VHFNSYASKWDEWIPAHSTRIVTWGACGASALDTAVAQPALEEAEAVAAAAQPAQLAIHALAAAPPHRVPPAAVAEAVAPKEVMIGVPTPGIFLGHSMPPTLQKFKKK
jgi:hypothetical protein